MFGIRKLFMIVIFGIYSFGMGFASFAFAGEPNIKPSDGHLGDNPIITNNDDGGTEYIGLPGAGGGEDGAVQAAGDALLNVIVSVINRTLGILGLIALIIVLYAGFLMLFSFGNDERFNKGRKILKYAAIALLIIGLAWFIVSIVFWLVGKVSGTGDGGSGAGQVVNDCNLFQPDADGNCFGNTKDIGIIGTDQNVGDGLVAVIKGAVNRVLGILALVALIIFLYGGFLMVTSLGEEDKYKKGWTIMKYAAIGLVVIGVARFIVSLVFWLVNITAKDAGPANTDQ